MFLSRIVLRDLDSIDSPASMASSKKVVTRDEWERKLRDVKIRKEDMNRLVMNFLVTEGFVDAADKFRIESGTQRIARSSPSTSSAAQVPLGNSSECFVLLLQRRLT